MVPIARVDLNNPDIKTLTFYFDGTGFALRGETIRRNHNLPHAEVKAKLYIDGEFIEEAVFPTNANVRRLDLFWRYQLPKGKHQVKMEVLEDNSNARLRSWDYIIYSD